MPGRNTLRSKHLDSILPIGVRHVPRTAADFSRRLPRLLVRLTDQRRKAPALFVGRPAQRAVALAMLEYGELPAPLDANIR